MEPGLNTWARLAALEAAQQALMLPLERDLELRRVLERALAR